MDMLKILNANFEAKDKSFLYYLPCDYNKKLETLECIIIKYFLGGGHEVHLFGMK